MKGDGFAEWSEVYGNTFRMNVLSENRVWPSIAAMSEIFERH